jgi:hypothetical protein
MIIFIFLIIFLIQIIVTFHKFKNTCKNPGIQTWSLYFAHHALDVFLFWSVLFLTTRTEFFLHLLAVIIVGIHWFTYDNKCIATVIMNRMCGYPESEWLDSLKNMFGLRSYSEYFQFVWIGLLAMYDIYKLVP